MAYLKPNAIVRKIFNPLAMRFGLSGSATLEIRRRKSGQTQNVPVIPVEHEGARYVVSTRGESDWVRNLRAAGGGKLRRKGQTKEFRAAEIPVEARPPIIEAYRAKVGREVEGYFKKLPDPADHPVFRLE
jgi:deazaflavin-dependent oxidoreductase (nitroreductase family)